MIKKWIGFTALVVAGNASHAKVDYLRVMFNANGDKQATIGWHQQSGEAKAVFWGGEDRSPENYKEYSNQARVTVRNHYKGMDNHFVRLVDLTPNTAYYFVIEDSEGVSERYWFKTTPGDSEQRLSLVAGGDSRSRREPRKMGFLMVGKLVPHAILFDGDYTDVDTEERWHGWFQDYRASYQSFDNRIIPIVTVRGNHEKSNECLVHFFDCQSAKNFYNVTLGGDLVNVICLNTEIIFGGAQKRFLKEVLAQHSSFSWQIPLYHRACRPHVEWKMKMYAVKAIYRKWIALFEQYGVRLAIECDSHITKTTWPIRKSKEKNHEDGFVRDDENGIVYAGEGCWGAPLRVPNRIRSWTRDAGQVNSFKWMFVSKDAIELRTVDYMNAHEVAALDEANRFTIPARLQLWSPENGAVVHLQK